MNARRIICIVATGILIAAVSNAMAQDLQIVGTWTLVSGKYNGKDGNLAGSNTMLKHVTPEQTLWVIYDKRGKVLEASGVRTSSTAASSSKRPATAWVPTSR